MGALHEENSSSFRLAIRAVLGENSSNYFCVVRKLKAASKVVNGRVIHSRQNLPQPRIKRVVRAKRIQHSHQANDKQPNE